MLLGLQIQGLLKLLNSLLTQDTASTGNWLPMGGERAKSGLNMLSGMAVFFTMPIPKQKHDRMMLDEGSVRMHVQMVTFSLSDVHQSAGSCRR